MWDNGWPSPTSPDTRSSQATHCPALAARFYGDAQLHRLIAAASGVADPDAIHAGQQLIIPEITRHTVVAGDTLSALAARFYGDASLYPLIATANRIADPNAIRPGQALVIFAGRSDGFGLTIVDRNENDPRMQYYRFADRRDRVGPRRQRPASRRLPHQRHTYPVLYLFHGGDRPTSAPVPTSRGIRSLTAGKPIIVVMPDGGARGLVLQPGHLASSGPGTGRPSTSPSCSRGSTRTSAPTPSTTAVPSPGSRWVASAR